MEKEKYRKSMWERDFCFLDIETAGLDPDADILEIAGLIVNSKDWQIKEEFEEKVVMAHFEKADPEALRINGYTSEKWKDAKPLKEVLEKLHPLFSGTVIAGFNSHFDWSRLERAYFEAGMEDPFYYQRIDVLSIANVLYPNMKTMPGGTLTSFCNLFGIERKHAHQALDDARVTYELFLQLLKKLKDHIN